MKIAIIGCGHMGAGIVDGILASDLDSELILLDSNDHLLEKYSKYPNINLAGINYSVIIDCDYLILAVRPQSIEKVFSDIKKYINNQFIISILAGVSLARLKELSGSNKVVRIMPNLAAKTQMSLTAMYSEEDNNEIEKILSTFGKLVKVKNEDDINSITALSGSGIAYVFYYMQAMIDKSIRLGFSEEESKKIIYQTFAGALSFGESISAKEFVNKIAVPGGTTEQAIKSFDLNNLDSIISLGIDSALNRARELAK